MNTAAKRKICRKYQNRWVKIKTVHGVYRGKIVKVDRHRVYLQALPSKGRNKATISFFPFILPLVLFDLLVIVLLDSRPRFRPYC